MRAALDAVSYRALLELTQDISFLEHAFGHALKVAAGGAVENVVEAYKQHSRLITTGERSANLGPNGAEQAVLARKAEAAINTEIAAHYAKAGPGGTRYATGSY
jgi:hypothetical protein